MRQGSAKAIEVSGDTNFVAYTRPMLDLPSNTFKKIALFGLTLFFVSIGVGHFTGPDAFLPLMPAYLPYHLELVYLSGVFEIGLGIAVLFPKVRRLAGFGLVALLVAVYPANINMALHPEPFVEQGISLAFIYGRLPFQFLFMAWAVWATRPDPVA